MLSCIQLFPTPWEKTDRQTVVYQAPLSMEFPRQEYWGRLPFSPPGDLPDSGMELASLMSLELAGGFFTTGTTWDALIAEVLVMVEMTKVENVGKRKKRNESQS